MKNIYLLFFFFLSVNTNAQLTVGEKILSSNLNFNNYNNDYVSSNYSTQRRYFNLNFNVSKVTAENKIKGLKFGYDNTKLENDNKLNVFTLGYFQQKIYPLKYHFFAFNETGISIMYSKQHYINYIFNLPEEHVTFKMVGGSVYANIGIGYRISKNFICDISYNNLIALNYSIKKNTTSSINYENISSEVNWGINSNISQNTLNGILVGIRWIFKHKYQN